MQPRKRVTLVCVFFFMLGVNGKDDYGWGWRVLFLSDKERKRVEG